MPEEKKDNSLTGFLRKVVNRKSGLRYAIEMSVFEGISHKTIGFLIAGFVFGFIFAIQQDYPTVQSISISFSISYLFSFAIAYLSHINWRLKWHPFNNNPYISIFLDIVLSLLLGGLAFFLSGFIPLTLLAGFDAAYDRIGDLIPASAWGIIFCVNGFIYSLNYEAWSENIKEKEDMKALAENTRAVALRSQMNPHFFFNALNTIASLIDNKPKEAERAIELLAESLRPALMRNPPLMGTVDSEVKMAESYSEIEKLRFGERVKFEFEVEVESLGIRIPSLLLQPLIENAVTHGASKFSDPFFILTRISNDEEAVSIFISSGRDLKNLKVDNDGTSKFKEGHALDNIVQRLNLIYGKNYQFNLLTGNEHSAMVNLKLPVEVAEKMREMPEVKFI